MREESARFSGLQVAEIMSDLVDLSEFGPGQKNAIIKELVTGHQMQMVQSEINQKKIAKENQRDHRSSNGFGRLVARFDLNGYLSNFIRKGESIQDNDYLKWVVKSHPEVAVKNVGTKTQVGHGS